jgi:undecaprenyl-diphosphatase
MNLLQAILYGAVQGLTEYLPVSSSAHLALLPKFLGTQDPGLSFDVFLHLGTLAATLIYFRREWLGLATSLHTSQGRKGMWNVVFATIPALAVGFVFRHQIEESLRGPHLIAVTLMFGGVLLYVVDRLAKGRRGFGEVESRDAWGVGLFQCLALVPGMSRSGSTILGARFMGLSRESAARFSFFISAPVTAAAVANELRHWNELVTSVSALSASGSQSEAFLILGAGAFSAFFFGWLAISGLIKLVSRVGFGAFAAYRVALGIVVLYWL